MKRNDKSRRHSDDGDDDDDDNLVNGKRKEKELNADNGLEDNEERICSPDTSWQQWKFELPPHIRKREILYICLWVEEENYWAGDEHKEKQILSKDGKAPLPPLPPPLPKQPKGKKKEMSSKETLIITQEQNSSSVRKTVVISENKRKNNNHINSKTPSATTAFLGAFGLWTRSRPLKLMPVSNLNATMSWDISNFFIGDHLSQRATVVLSWNIPRSLRRQGGENVFYEIFYRSVVSLPTNPKADAAQRSGREYDDDNDGYATQPNEVEMKAKKKENEDENEFEAVEWVLAGRTRATCFQVSNVVFIHGEQVEFRVASANTFATQPLSEAARCKIAL
mmetsp:Transcript_39236/g.63882  ORF Transcript_39236/g.63882 Transcript_39236/m.63882 type:complete len:337 (+) Transcript_39236:447-1457(+)